MTIFNHRRNVKFWIVLTISLIVQKVSFTQLAPLSDVQFYNENGEEYQNPYTGGIRAPQLSKVDLNFDGLEDLLLFDRDGNVYTSYIATEANSVEYKHDPQWIKNFPKIKIWMTMVDYDQDGIKDIFSFPDSSGIPGVQVWKGKIDDGLYAFDKIRFPDEIEDILFYPIGNGSTQVYVGVIDIPVVKDLDGDGDIDILSFDPGASKVNFYKNLAVEESLPLTELKYIEEDGCYGRFVESGLSQDVILSRDGEGCGNSLWDVPQPTVRHTGSTLEVFDHNGDGLFDLLIGDASYNGLTMLTNEREGVPWMSSSELGYPASNPVEFELFITPSFLDIDNDGIGELMITANDTRTSQTKENFWYYENTADIGFAPSLTSKDFLGSMNIDLGESSLPAIADYNGDGLMDIVVGTSGKFINTSEKEPSLFLYENIGDKGSPKYQLVDTDYLALNSFKETSSFFAPAFGDLDGDDDIDLIVGDNRGRMYYLENVAGPGLPFDFATPIYSYKSIQVSGFARPAIEDLNQDGLGDLIIGERNFNSTDDFPIASINYFENTGVPGRPDFESNINQAPNSAALGGINLKQTNFINNNSATAFWENQNEFVLMTGSESGEIRQFRIDKNDVFAEYEEIFNSNIGGIDAGEESAPALADIDDDGLLELIVGNIRGGVQLYETDVVIDKKVSSSEEVIGTSVEIFPNPSDHFIKVVGDHILNDVPIQIYDINGKLRASSISKQVDLKGIESGIYFLRVLTSDGVGVKQFVKI